MTDAMNPFAGRNVPWLLRSRAEHYGEKEALVFVPLDGEPSSWSYAQLRDESERLAAALAARGVTRGTRVCVHLDNRPEYLFSVFAVLQLGAVAVLTNTRSTSEELEGLLTRTAAAVVVTESRHLTTVADTLATTDVGLIAVADLVDTGELTSSEELPAEAVTFSNLRTEATLPPEVEPGPMDPATILFTSGTTGRPKGVVWTHANYLWAGKVCAAHERLREDDRYLTYLPLFHVIGHNYAAMATLWSGGTVVLSPRFSASRFWSIAVRHKVTYVAMVRFALRALRERPVPADHRIRQWATNVCAPPWDDTFGIPTLGWWGMTETVSQGIVSEPSSPEPSMAIGTPAPEYELRVVDENGSGVPPGEPGLLEIRGRRGVSVALGYLDEDDTRRAWSPDGWLTTGDRVVVTHRGWIRFVDREKDILKVGGENVAASEVEQVVESVPGVYECAVVSRPHPMLDEVPVAVVVLDASAVQDAESVIARIGETCATRLSEFKRPRDVLVWEALPRGATGKVSKVALRIDLEFEQST